MKLTHRTKCYLLLEDGSLFEGLSIGKKGTMGGEICFNTGMTGYQEIYTDPSYFGQIIVNTSAHIGNYGTLSSEQESEGPKISGLVVNEFSEAHSRNTADNNLQEYLERNDIVGITDLDTRAIVRHIRDKGAMNAIISSELEPDALEEKLKEIPSMAGLELSTRVCTTSPYILGDQKAQFKVAVLDLGIKKSILDNFLIRDCQCHVFPAQTGFSEMQKWQPDGYFLSNGPGDPAAMDYAVETVSEILKEDIPLFGICLGHQILARAVGIATYKMHHGHRGINHPVKNLKTGRAEVTSQNHGFAVSEEAVTNSKDVDITHINLNDETIEGFELVNKKAFSVQYHPEASPGPHDSRYLFDHFISFIKTGKPVNI